MSTGLRRFQFLGSYGVLVGTKRCYLLNQLRTDAFHPLPDGKLGVLGQQCSDLSGQPITTLNEVGFVCGDTLKVSNSRLCQLKAPFLQKLILQHQIIVIDHSPSTPDRLVKVRRLLVTSQGKKVSDLMKADKSLDRS